MSKHHFFKSSEHYANFVRSIFRQVGIGMPDEVYESFIDLFETAEEFGIFSDVSAFSWEVKQRFEEGFNEDDFIVIKHKYQELLQTVSDYRSFEK